MKFKISGLNPQMKIEGIKAIRFVSGTLGLKDSKDLFESSYPAGSTALFDLVIDSVYPNQTLLNNAALAQGSYTPIAKTLTVTPMGKEPSKMKVLEMAIALLKKRNADLETRIASFGNQADERYKLEDDLRGLNGRLADKDYSLGCAHDDIKTLNDMITRLSAPMKFSVNGIDITIERKL